MLKKFGIAVVFMLTLVLAGCVKTDVNIEFMQNGHVKVVSTQLFDKASIAMVTGEGGHEAFIEQFKSDITSTLERDKAGQSENPDETFEPLPYLSVNIEDIDEDTFVGIKSTAEFNNITDFFNSGVRGRLTQLYPLINANDPENAVPDLKSIDVTYSEGLFGTSYSFAGDLSFEVITGQAPDDYTEQLKDASLGLSITAPALSVVNRTSGQQSGNTSGWSADVSTPAPIEYSLFVPNVPMILAWLLGIIILIVVIIVIVKSMKNRPVTVPEEDRVSDEEIIRELEAEGNLPVDDADHTAYADETEQNIDENISNTEESATEDNVTEENKDDKK